MTTPELKPCPFCGGEASISKDHDPDGNGAFYAVKCRKCHAKSPEIYAVETCNIHFAQVRDAWNRRADLAAIQPAHGVWNKCTFDLSGALDKLIAEAVGPYVEAMRYYETQFCEGFCEDMPDRSVTNEGMENDCSGCKARAILAAIEPQPDQTVEIDLRAAMMDELEKAASESPWVPKEYYMNEVISDCCAFLRSDRPQPDPRDAQITALVEALRLMRSTYPYNPPCYGWVEQVEAHKTAKAALAAAKAVMK